MAFRILSEEEKSYLSEEELLCYEEELDIYNARVDFVNKLEKLENVEIKEYNPKLDKISAIKKVEEKVFEKPSFNKVVVDKKEIPSNIELINKINSIKPIGQVSIDISENVDTDKINKSVERNRNIKSKFEMPSVEVAENLFSSKIPEPVEYNPFEINAEMTEMPRLDIRTEVKEKHFLKERYEAQISNDILKKADVKIPEVSFAMSERTAICLDTQVAPLPQIKNFDFEVPEVQGISQTVAKIDAEQKSFELPKISAVVPDIKIKSEIKAKEFKFEKHSISQMPDVNIPSVKDKKIDIPDVEVVGVSQIRIKDFTPVDYKCTIVKPEKVELNIDVKMPGNVEYKKPEIKKVDLSAVPYLRG